MHIILLDPHEGGGGGGADHRSYNPLHGNQREQSAFNV